MSHSTALLIPLAGCIVFGFLAERMRKNRALCAICGTIAFGSWLVLAIDVFGPTIERHSAAILGAGAAIVASATSLLSWAWDNALLIAGVWAFWFLMTALSRIEQALQELRSDLRNARAR
jgi:hypothetical protein